MHSKEPDCVYEIDHPFKTKDGADLRLVYSENVEADNRAFVSDDVSAFIGETKVGYLQIGNFSPSLFPKFFPGPLNYLNHHTGLCLLDSEDENADLRTAPIEVINRLVVRLCPHFGRLNDAPRFGSYAEFDAWMKKEIEPSARYKAYMKDRAHLVAVRADRPIVDFVATTSSSNNKGLYGDFTRRGIALALYQAAAIECEVRGMRLHQSGVIREKAAAVWKKLDDLGYVVKDGERLQLDGQRIADDIGFDIAAKRDSHAALAI